MQVPSQRRFAVSAKMPWQRPRGQHMRRGGAEGRISLTTGAKHLPMVGIVVTISPSFNL